MRNEDPAEVSPLCFSMFSWVSCCLVELSAGGSRVPQRQRRRETIPTAGRQCLRARHPAVPLQRGSPSPLRERRGTWLAAVAAEIGKSACSSRDIPRSNAVQCGSGQGLQPVSLGGQHSGAGSSDSIEAFLLALACGAVTVSG